MPITKINSSEDIRNLQADIEYLRKRVRKLAYTNRSDLMEIEFEEITSILKEKSKLNPEKYIACPNSREPTPKQYNRKMKLDCYAGSYKNIFE